jgi:hypothetical protein
LLEQAEDAEAARAYDRAKVQRDQESVPIAVADALLAGRTRSGCGATIGA